MDQAEEIYSREFDRIFLELPPDIRAQIETKLGLLGRKLDGFPHYRMQGREEFRLRVGDYRIIYQIDVPRNLPYLVTLGHRREVYKRL
jgi:mRNA interferase RelE/StbE